MIVLFLEFVPDIPSSWEYLANSSRRTPALYMQWDLLNIEILGRLDLLKNGEKNRLKYDPPRRDLSLGA